MLKLYANVRSQYSVHSKSANYLYNIMEFIKTTAKEYDNPKVYSYTTLGAIATVQIEIIEDILGLLFFGPSFRVNPNYNHGINIRTILLR